MLVKSISLNKPCHNELEKARASTKDPEPTPKALLGLDNPVLSPPFVLLMKPAQAQRANGEHQGSTRIDLNSCMCLPTPLIYNTDRQKYSCTMRNINNPGGGGDCVNWRYKVRVSEHGESNRLQDALQSGLRQKI